MVLIWISRICKCAASSYHTNEEKENTEKSPDMPSMKRENPSEDYDPHSHGKLDHPTIFWGPIFHLFKYTVGTGILTLPYAFRNVGYGVAIFAILLAGLIYVHVLHKLLEVEYELCKKLRTPKLTYAEVVQHSFEQGPRCFRRFAYVAKFMVYFHFIFNKSVLNAIYLVTIGGNLKVIVDHYYNIDVNLASVITPLMMIIISLALIRNLKSLAPLSLLTNSLNLISFGLILTIPMDYYGLNDLKAINDVTKFPNFFALAMMAFNCTILVIPLKSDMKDPKKFGALFGVLNISTVTSAILYCAFGLLGYAKYGEDLQPNILHNLPPDQLVPLVILGLFSCTISISIILTIYVALETIINNILGDRKMKHPQIAGYACRIALCILPYAIVVALPDFKIMVALGGVIAILMDETVPIVLHMLLLAQMKPKTTGVYLALIKDLGLVSICISLFSSAVLDLIRSIIKFYS